MKNRIKLTSPAIKSRLQAEALVREIAEITLTRNGHIIDLDRQVTELRERYEATLASCTKRLEEKTELLRAWAEANPDEFNGLKSLEMTHGIVGWRTGQPTLKTLAGWTWDRVLEKVKSLGAAWSTYVRISEEVNKQALLGDRESIGPDQLRVIGVRVVQSESFYIEPKLAELENRQNTTATTAAA